MKNWQNQTILAWLGIFYPSVEFHNTPLFLNNLHISSVNNECSCVPLGASGSLGSTPVSLKLPPADTRITKAG